MVVLVTKIHVWFIIKLIMTKRGVSEGNLKYGGTKSMTPMTVVHQDHFIDKLICSEKKKLSTTKINSILLIMRQSLRQWTQLRLRVCQHYHLDFQ